MYVLDVIALAPNSPAAPLSYRSKERHGVGTIVTIPLRRQSVRGIVVGVADVREQKAMLKSADFALAKSVTKADGTFAKPLVDACVRIAEYHAVPIGSVIHTLLSDTIAIDIPRVFPRGEGYARESIEYPLRVRMGKYRRIIEEAAKDQKATLLIVPTTAELAYFKAALADLDPIVLSGELGTTARIAALTKALTYDGLILATPTYAFLPVRTLAAIILERVSAGSYRLPKRPYLDRVRVADEVAKARAVPLHMGDFPLPLEYRTRPDQGVFNTPSGTAESVDVREALAQGESFKAIPDATLKRIRKALKENERVVVIAGRRGYAPSVACRDCGTTLRDEDGRAYMLATKDGKRVLRTALGSEISPKVLCPVCGSWNLMGLGIGIERVVEELKEAFPEDHIVRFDADSIKTDAAGRRALAAFKEKRGIMVGTESSLAWLPQLDEPIALAVVASIDTLLSVPFWRARERFVRIGLMLREAAEHTIFQTRRPDDLALAAVLNPKEDAFFAEETSLRRALSYSPFGTLLLVESIGSRKRLIESRIEIISAVLPYAPTVLPARAVPKKGFRETALVPIPGGVWPESAIAQKLQALPPFMRVIVDPESFW